MLDVARKTFLQSMEDIYQTADSMTEENGYHVKVIKRVRLYCHSSFRVRDLLRPFGGEYSSRPDLELSLAVEVSLTFPTTLCIALGATGHEKLADTGEIE